MNEKSQKKKNGWQQYLALLVCFLIGGFFGVFIGGSIGRNFAEGAPFIETMLITVGLFLSLYVAIVFQMILHEAGHLVFGLLSGYRFSSFRVFSIMWIRNGEKIKIKRLSVAGTGGQCLMAPPDMVDGKIPVVLYNLGGSIMNLIAGALFLTLHLIFIGSSFLSTVLIFFAVFGFIFAVINGVPMRLGTVDNDGYNAYAMTRSAEAMRAFWVQLKVDEQLTKNIRLKDMPSEWFTLPSDEAMKNSMVAVIGVFACNRLMDSAKFEEADALMAHMTEIDSGMVGLHRGLMICDRMYVELITENRPEVLDTMLTKEQKTLMKQMKKFPTVLRTEYTYALLCEKDVAKAEKLRGQFEKYTARYPYQSDVMSERMLMELAMERANMTEQLLP